jgi:hypothetical protein
MLLDKVVDRARSLGLRVRMDKQEERLMDLASLLTAMAVTRRACEAAALRLRRGETGLEPGNPG